VNASPKCSQSTSSRIETHSTPKVPHQCINPPIGPEIKAIKHNFEKTPLKEIME